MNNFIGVNKMSYQKIKCDKNPLIKYPYLKNKLRHCSILGSVLFTAILLSCSNVLAEEPTEEPVADIYPADSTEWFSLHLGGGLYGPGGQLGFFTLRWPWFYYEIIRLHFYMGGPPQLDEGQRMQLGLGGTFGVPWRIDSRNEHELRFGLNVGFDVMYGGITKTNTGQVNDSSQAQTVADIADDLFDTMKESNSTVQWWFGLSLGPEISYVWHCADHVALQVGFVVYFATLPPGNAGLFWATPKMMTPSPIGYVGLRF